MSGATSPSDDRAGRPTGGRPARTARSGPTAADRVVRSQAQTRATLALSLGFVIAAAAAALLDGSRWLVLHLLLAGGVGFAIAAVSSMLAVTWSAAPAPPAWVVIATRALLFLGTVGVAAGRTLEAPEAVVATAGASYLAGLLVLGVTLVVTVSRGVERRFDPAVAGYAAALVAGITGVGLGIAMATGAPSGELRDAHVTANVFGFVGLVVASTMPYFAATVGRSKMSVRARPQRLSVTFAAMAGSVGLAVVALASGSATPAASALVLYAIGIGLIVRLLPRPTRRQLTWAGPRVIALWAGAAWWAVAAIGTAVDAARGDAVLAGRWLIVVVLGAYLQILWGSLAYVIPMLRGGGPAALSTGFDTTRSWFGLGAANASAVAAAVGAPRTWVVAVATVWFLDTFWRLARVGLRRAARPPVSDV